jgi:hypothetical protein
MLAATTIGRRQTKRLITLLVAAGLLGGCARKKSADLIPDPRMWLIESYDHGTITANNDGKTYKATCEGHRTVGPDQFVYDAAPLFPCNMAIDEVGHRIQPFTLDSDFRKPLLFMGHAPHGALVLRRQNMIETFAVTSVAKTDH